MFDVRRREFISLLGGAAAAWPMAARAQGKQPVVGFLASGEPKSMAPSSAGFLAGLKEAGFVDGRNLTIEYRWAEGRFDRLPGLAAELVHRRVDVIMAAQGTVSARAAKQATSSVPIVFVTADDPVAAGLVATLNRPGGNLTGVTRMSTILVAKNLELIREVVPAVSHVGLLINPKRPTVDAQRKIAAEAAAILGITIRVLDGSGETEIDAAFQTIVSEQIGALLVPVDSVLNAHGPQILALAARHRLPAAYALREFVSNGGLMSYGDSATESYALAGGYVGRILKGGKPADLPVRQATSLELALNLKTAKMLGLAISPVLVGRADMLIE